MSKTSKRPNRANRKKNTRTLIIHNGLGTPIAIVKDGGIETTTIELAFWAMWIQHAHENGLSNTTMNVAGDVEVFNSNTGTQFSFMSGRSGDYLEDKLFFEFITQNMVTGDSVSVDINDELFDISVAVMQDALNIHNFHYGWTIHRQGVDAPMTRGELAKYAVRDEASA